VSSSTGRISGSARGELPGVPLLHQLTRLSRAVAQAASIEEILQLAATQAAGMLDADRTVLMLLGDDGLAHVRASDGVDVAITDSLTGTLDEGLVARLEHILGEGSRSFLAVPLIVQGTVTGLLAVTRPGTEGWRPEAEAALAAIADQSAAPLEIARLSEEVRQARLVAENVRLGAAERTARAELEAERARLETVLDNIPSGVVLAEAPSGRVLFRNRVVARLTGVPDSEVPGIAHYTRVPGFRQDGRPYAPEDWPLSRAISRGETVSGEEIELHRPDGSRVILSVNAAPVRGTDDSIVAAVTTFHDVTQRRRVEQHLRQVQQMEAVGRLAGGMAHETNNQMSVVLSAAILALRHDPSPAVRKDLEAIKRAAERTAAVTAQLLAFSRKQIVRPEVLDLGKVIREFAPVLRRTLGEDSILLLPAGQEVFSVRADRGQIEQVLLNLALNARDAMPEGGRLAMELGVVELSDEYGSFKSGVAFRPGSYVMLAVSDTGTGMDQQTLTHLFEPFFTTKPVGQGTGLGLSTVYGIVKQSDGYVWPYSEPGQGTTFKIYLPSVGGAPSAPLVTAQPESARSGEVILVVEDEESVRVMTHRLLESEGYACLEAADGAEAVELLAGAARVDLVITDVVMPTMNGRQLAQRLEDLRPGLPVLFMSGYTDDEMVRRGLIEPGYPFLSKPFTPEVLAAKVRQLIDETAGRRTR
jgi:PAS domain S-box-containing protein